MNVFDLFAKISLDTSEYDKGLDDASKKSSSFGSKIMGGLGTAAKTTAAAIGAVTTAATAAVTSLTKSAMSGYADYEQLVGGVETLFGSSYESVEEYAKSTGMSLKEAEKSFEQYQNRAKSIMENADNAYKTAGLSANEYMETVTGFAAALNASLGKNAWQSANYADMAITDMADNANKMGTSMESIQNAYAGFSKQNYTMLDNLKLGYGGTKEEMERLLRDAEKIEGYKVGSFDISNFADIVEAIHIVQDNLGIAGATEEEAATTISGSLGMLKSSWENLITGLANGEADIDLLIGNVVESAETAFKNLFPTIERALKGIAKLVEKTVPIIAKKLPSLINDLLPTILTAISQLTNAIINALPEILSVLINQVPMIFDMIVPTFLNMLPQIIDLGFQLILALAMGIADSMPELVPTIVDVIIKIVDILTEPDNLMMLIDASIAIIIALAEGLVNALPRLLDKAPVIVQNLVTAIIDATPKLINAAIQMLVVLVAGIADNLSTVIEAGMDIVLALIEGIIDWLSSLVKIGSEMGTSIQEGFSDFIDGAKQWGSDLIKNFIDGITEKWNALKEKVSGVAQTVKDYLGFSEPDKGPLSDFHTYAPDMMKLFASGIRDNAKLLTDAVRDTFDIQPVIQSNGIKNVEGVSAAGAGVGGIVGDIIIPVYIGDEPIQEIVIKADQINNYVSGGR